MCGIVSRVRWRRNNTTDTPTTARRIGLVGCVKDKASAATLAQDLYTSPLFAGRRRFVEQSCTEWWILSAEHGLVNPGTVLDPYDVALKTMGTRQRREWATRVLAQIAQNVAPCPGDVVEFHAGADYRDYGLADGLRRLGVGVENPTEGMRIGAQLSFYAKLT